MNHLEAKETILRALPSLTDPQRLVVQGISFLETGYGNWGPDPLKGAGSNNMGAITDPSYVPPAPADSVQFLHKDSRPATPKEILSGRPPVITYTTAFRKYTSPEAGFQDVAHTALKPNVNAAILAKDLYGVSSAMHGNVYYTGVLPTAKQNIDAHYRSLSNAVNAILAATNSPSPFLPTIGGVGSPAAPLSSLVLPDSSSILPLPLQVGSLGPFVQALQRFLKVAPDGVFGRKTETAVMRLQALLGLKPDGIVGEDTWKAIND